MLASPIIEGTLPAFYLDDNGIAQIAVPFSMSRAVNKNQIKGFKLKIKNVQQSNYLVTLTQSSVDFVKSIVYFNISKETLKKSFFGQETQIYNNFAPVKPAAITTALIKIRFRKS